MRSTFKKTITKTTNHVEKSHHMGTSLKCITNRYNRNTCPPITHKPTSPVASSQKEEKLPKKEMSKKVKSHQNENEIELSVHGVSENVTDNRYDNMEKKVIDPHVQSGMDSATNQWLHTVEADQKHSTIEIRSPNIPEDSSDVNQLISLIQEQYPVKRYQATDVTPSNASIVPLMDCSTLANGSNNYMGDVKIATSENGTHSEGDEDATKSGPSETKHSAFNNIMRSTFKKTLTKTTNHVEKSHHMGTSLKCITNRYNRNTCPPITHKPTSPVASSQKEEKLPKKEMSKKVKSHQNENEIELSVHGVSENVTDNRYDNMEKKGDVKIATSENGTHTEGDEDATKSGPSETKNSALNNTMGCTFKKTITKTANDVEKSRHIGIGLKCITNRYNRNTCPNKPTSPVASSQKEVKSSDVNQWISLIQEQYPVKRSQACDDVTLSNASIVPLMDCSTLANGSNNYMVQASRLPVIA